MAKYVAFLKAINVGGHVVKMDVLRDLFTSLKFSSVETFIASGNVIFDTKAAPDAKLEQKLEKRLEAALGYRVGTFVRSIDEIREISVYQPFSTEGYAVNVGFMRGTLAASVAEQVQMFATDVDEFHVWPRNLLAFPHPPERFEILGEEVRKTDRRRLDMEEYQHRRPPRRQI